MKRSSAMLLSAVLFQFIGTAAVAQKSLLIAESQYSDANGFFMVVPPANWRTVTYPTDSRGKVAFIGPEGAELRILAKALDHASFDSMLAEIKDIEKSLGIDTHIEIKDFVGNRSVHRRFQMKGLQILFIDFMIGNASHNLMYSAQPQAVFDRHLPTALASLSTYLPALREMSLDESYRHRVARALRLAQLYLEGKRYKLARQFINEGLSIEPDNARLNELKTKLPGSETSITVQNREPRASSSITNTTEEKASIPKPSTEGEIIVGDLGANELDAREGAVKEGSEESETKSLLMVRFGVALGVFGLVTLFFILTRLLRS